MGRRSVTLAGFAACATLLAGCGGSSADTPELAFVTSRDGDYAIYVSNGDDARRLTPGGGEPSTPAGLFFQFDPAWSPDGGRIAFASKREGTFDIFVMDADGTGTRRLTTTKEDDSGPSWSPDGTQIAFQRGDVGDIYVMATDGTKVRKVAGDHADEIEPAWSPDGRWIAYVRRQPGTPVHELWLVRPDGTGPTQLTHLGARSSEPAWSPDGRRIAYATTSGGTNYDVYAMTVDAKSSEQLTSGAEDELEPAWSPDGKRLAFTRDGAIVVRDEDGGERIVTSGENDGSPVWRPAPAADSG